MLEEELSTRSVVLFSAGWVGYTRELMVTVPSSAARTYSGDVGTGGGAG